MCVSSRVQMRGHSIHLRCSRQVWGSVAGVLSALITEQAQERAQAHTETHTPAMLPGQLNVTGNAERIYLKWRRRLQKCLVLMRVEAPLHHRWIQANLLPALANSHKHNRTQCASLVTGWLAEGLAAATWLPLRSHTHKHTLSYVALFSDCDGGCVDHSQWSPVDILLFASGRSRSDQKSVFSNPFFFRLKCLFNV